jgi:hypothetical protein
LAFVLPATAWFAVSRRPDVPRDEQRVFLVCAAVLGGLTTAHAWSCRAAFETVGEVASGAWYLAFPLYLFPFGFLTLRWVRLAVGTAVVLAMVFVTPQVVWSIRLEWLRGEVQQIVAFVEQFKETTGHYPGDLSNYEFDRPQLQRYVDYFLTSSNNNSFAVQFWPAERGVSHSYSSMSGWGYYPD